MPRHDSMAPVPRRPREPLAAVHYADEPVDVRAWARTYVNILLSLEGVALVPAPITEPLKHAS